MVETIKVKEENMKKIKENAETRMAVYTHYIYCHLENKKTLICKFLKLNNRIRDRTALIIRKYEVCISSY